jgi:hypothetical protein
MHSTAENPSFFLKNHGGIMPLEYHLSRPLHSPMIFEECRKNLRCGDAPRLMQTRWECNKMTEHRNTLQNPGGIVVANIINRENIKTYQIFKHFKG